MPELGNEVKPPKSYPSIRRMGSRQMEFDICNKQARAFRPACTDNQIITQHYPSLGIRRKLVYCQIITKEFPYPGTSEYEC